MYKWVYDNQDREVNRPTTTGVDSNGRLCQRAIQNDFNLH